MAKTAKNCLQLLLKIANSMIGAVGIAMVMYSLWMVRAWQRDLDGSSPDYDTYYSLPWRDGNIQGNNAANYGKERVRFQYDKRLKLVVMFIHAFLGVGIALCATTCLGHIAANTANACCLFFYMIAIFVLLLVETGLIADIFLNSDWEKDLPDDPSGRLEDFKDFVESNFDTCRWIALLIILAQGCSVLLATVLRTLRTDVGGRYYMQRSGDNDDEEEANAPPRLWLLHHHTND